MLQAKLLQNNIQYTNELAGSSFTDTSDWASGSALYADCGILSVAGNGVNEVPQAYQQAAAELAGKPLNIRANCKAGANCIYIGRACGTTQQS